MVANVAIEQSAVSPPRKERIINLIDMHMVLYSRVFKVCSGKMPSLEERGIRVEALVEEKVLLGDAKKGGRFVPQGGDTCCSIAECSRSALKGGKCFLIVLAHITLW